MKSLNYLSLAVLSLTVLISCLPLRPIPFSRADQPPGLVPSANRRSPRPPTAHYLFLEAVYGNIKYPKAAREPKVQGNFQATYRINCSGEIGGLVFEERNFGHTDDTIFLWALGSSHAFKPTKSFTAEDSLAGKQAIVAEIERVLDLLPTFQPALRNGRPIAVRKKTRFEFRVK